MFYSLVRAFYEPGNRAECISLRALLALIISIIIMVATGIGRRLQFIIAFARKWGLGTDLLKKYIEIAELGLENYNMVIVQGEIQFNMKFGSNPRNAQEAAELIKNTMVPGNSFYFYKGKTLANLIYSNRKVHHYMLHDFLGFGETPVILQATSHLRKGLMDGLGPHFRGTFPPMRELTLENARNPAMLVYDQAAVDAGETIWSNPKIVDYNSVYF